MVKASHCESGDMGLNPAGTETCVLFIPPSPSNFVCGDIALTRF